MNIDDIKANKPDDELQALIKATEDMVIYFDKHLTLIGMMYDCDKYIGMFNGI